MRSGVAESAAPSFRFRRMAGIKCFPRRGGKNPVAKRKKQAKNHIA